MITGKISLYEEQTTTYGTTFGQKPSEKKYKEDLEYATSLGFVVGAKVARITMNSDVVYTISRILPIEKTKLYGNNTELFVLKAQSDVETALAFSAQELRLIC